MDAYGSVHVVDFKNKEQVRVLEEYNGKLIEIPEEDIEKVKYMNRTERRAYWKRHTHANRD